MGASPIGASQGAISIAVFSDFKGLRRLFHRTRRAFLRTSYGLRLARSMTAPPNVAFPQVEHRSHRLARKCRFSEMRSPGLGGGGGFVPETVIGTERKFKGAPAIWIAAARAVRIPCAIFINC
jgi:hypothetical protein